MLDRLLSGFLSFAAFVIGLIAIILLWMLAWPVLLILFAAVGIIGWLIYRHIKKVDEQIEEAQRAAEQEEFQRVLDEEQRQAQRQRDAEAAQAASQSDPHDRKDITDEATEEDVK